MRKRFYNEIQQYLLNNQISIDVNNYDCSVYTAAFSMELVFGECQSIHFERNPIQVPFEVKGLRVHVMYNQVTTLPKREQRNTDAPKVIHIAVDVNGGYNVGESWCCAIIIIAFCEVLTFGQNCDSVLLMIG